MSINGVISIGGIVISIFAAVSIIVLFIRTRSNAQRASFVTADITTRRAYSGAIGILNFLISISMATVVIADSLPSSGNVGSSSLVAHLTFLGVILTGVFIVCQTIYLFLPQTLFSKKAKTPDQSMIESVDSIQKKNEDLFETQFRRCLLNDNRLKFMQILNMPYSLSTTTMYVQTKVYQESAQFTVKQLEELEERFTPLEQLYKRLEILEDKVERAIDPVKMITSKRHCVLLGEPGTGKTTFLKYLTVKVAENSLLNVEQCLPFYVSLNDYLNDSKDKNILDYTISNYSDRYSLFLQKYCPPVSDLPSENSSHVSSALRNLLKKKLQNGAVIFLFDALDEAYKGEDKESAQKTQKDIWEKIVSFEKEYSDSYMFVTSRKPSYELLLKHGESGVGNNVFKKLEMLGFLQNDIRKFVEQWFIERPLVDKDISADHLLLKLQQDSRLRELSANPLMLSIIVDNYIRDKEIASYRVQLYSNCVASLLEYWDTSRGIERYNGFEDKNRDFLRQLAWYLHERMYSYFGKEDIQKFIESRGDVTFTSDDVKSLLKAIATGSGLLMESDESRYCFSHLTFQEFFAAEYKLGEIQKSKQDEREELEENFLHLRQNPWWEEVILLYAGLTENSDSILSRLMKEEHSDIFCSYILFAGRCIAAAPRRSQSKEQRHKELIDKLFQQLKDAKFQFLADLLAQSLTQMADEETNNTLLELLSNGNTSPVARQSIAKALGAWGNWSVASELARLLLVQKITDNTIRSHIAKALGRLGDKSVAVNMAEYLLWPSKSDSSRVRIVIIEALGNLREPAVIPQLCECMRSRYMTDDEKDRIAGTLGILGSLLDSVSGNTSDTQQIKKKLEKTLRDVICDKKVAATVRYACTGAIGRWHNVDMIPALRDLLENQKIDWALRGRVVVVLQMLNEGYKGLAVSTLLENEGIEALVPTALVTRDDIKVSTLLEDEGIEAQARCDLIQFLIAQRAYTIIPELTPLIRDEHIHQDVRMKLIEASGELGDEEVGKDLLEYLQAETLEYPLRCAIVEAAGALNDNGILKYTQLFPVLRKILGTLTEHEIDLLERCADVISELGESDDEQYAIEILQTLMKTRIRIDDPAANNRIAIIRGKLDDKSARTELEDMLLTEEPEKGGEDTHLRKQVVRALVKLDNQETVKKLQEKLRTKLSLTSEKLSLDETKDVLKVFTSIASDAETCEVLIDLLDQPVLDEIKEDIYESLWEVSRRGNLRVFEDTDGSIKVEPVRIPEPSATARS